MPRDLVGQTLQDSYRVERLIGEGGMGAVYEAAHLRVPRKVAVKVLQGTADSLTLERFRREAQLIGGLGHPHIVEVLDFDRTDDGVPFIVMELLKGETLAERLGRGRLDLLEAAAILRQTASALHAVHAVGIIHRDLKPQNIFLCRIGQRDRVKLLDFGVSKLIGAPTVTQAEALIGSPVYMSPEQADQRAAEVDERSDVYSLGCMAFEMLSGRPPLGGRSLAALLYNIVHTPAPSLRELRPELPEAVIAAVDTALAKAPGTRHASVAQFWRAVALAIANGKLPFQEPTDDGLVGWMLSEPDPPQPASRLATGPGVGGPRLHVETTLSGSVGERAAPSETPRRVPLGWVVGLGVAAAAAAGGGVSLLLGLRAPERPATTSATPPPVASSTPALPPPVVTPTPPPLARANLPPDAAAPAPPRRVPRKVAARPKAEAGVGEIFVAVSAGGSPISATVLLDGKPVGLFGPTRFLREVPAGKHTLRISAPGHLARDFPVRVRAGEQVKLPAKLDARRGQ